MIKDKKSLDKLREKYKKNIAGEESSLVKKNISTLEEQMHEALLRFKETGKNSDYRKFRKLQCQLAKTSPAELAKARFSQAAEPYIIGTVKFKRDVSGHFYAERGDIAKLLHSDAVNLFPDVMQKRVRSSPSSELILFEGIIRCVPNSYLSYPKDVSMDQRLLGI